MEPPALITNHRLNSPLAEAPEYQAGSRGEEASSLPEPSSWKIFLNFLKVSGWSLPDADQSPMADTPEEKRGVKQFSDSQEKHE